MTVGITSQRGLARRDKMMPRKTVTTAYINVRNVIDR